MKRPPRGVARRDVLLGAAAGLAFGAAGVRAAAEERVIAVVARKFVFVPREITLRAGEAVILELSAPEVMMGINAPALGLRADIVPGRPTRLRVPPQKPGRYPFSCDVFCGSGHEDMEGVIVVSV
jgi:cytochrome c oxidase subunit 2